MAIDIVRATERDGGAVAAIYNHYIRETVVTFEEEEVSDTDMSRRIAEINNAGAPWLLARSGDDVIGFAYASTWNGRCAYRFSKEVTVYLAPDAGGRGTGSALYAALFERLRDGGIHTVIGGIALPNAASVALHEKFGMTKVAHFSRVGYKFGEWIDVGYWQGFLDEVPREP